MKCIKNVRKKLRSFADIKGKLIKIFHTNSSILDECAIINAQRTYYLSLIAIPTCMIDIFLFVFTKSYDTPVKKAWSRGIITSHSALIIIMFTLLLTTHKLKNKTKPSFIMYMLQYVVVTAIMASGIIIVTIDQLVTTNITPFILICVISGSFFLIRPLVSVIIYIISYIAYYYLIALNTTSQEVLLSNRANGIIAIGIGIMLSNILWHYNFTNITQKRLIENQQKRLEQMAYYDPLTDLPNRRLLEKLIRKEYYSMKRYGHETAIIILDIDNFKFINDTYGHPVGDNILKQLAELLKINVRELDTVSRFGGEEFIILMPETSLEGGYAFAERLRKLIMERKFRVGSTELQITSSFGISSLGDISSPTLDDYYFLADKALYWAKQCGKNRVEVACGEKGKTV